MASTFRNPLCLPFLFYELLQEHSSGGLTELSVSKAYLETFGREPSSDDMPKIIERLILEAKETAERGPSDQYKPKKKQVFGTSLSDYFSNLNSEQLCFFLADFDPVKARELYSCVDMKEVSVAAREKIGYVAEMNGVRFEAVMFGMGGSYKGSGANDQVIDLTDDVRSAAPQLKALGLM